MNAKLYLNNKKIFLNGIARHEEFGTDGRIMYYDISKKLVDDLKIVKDLNANFIRTAHYPNHPFTYILTDRFGISVMEEIPVMWFDGPEFDFQRKVKGLARQFWYEMIFRDFNRASIFFWSTCNECGWQDERRAYIWDLKLIANKIDGTRFIGQSAAGSDVLDPSHIDCDYYGATMYWGVFYGNSCFNDTKKALQKICKYYDKKPIIATEFGIWANKDLSYTNKQVEVAEQTYKAFKENENVTGVVWWTLFDWWTMNGNPYQSMGLVSMDRKYFKPAFFKLQKLYGNFDNDAIIEIISPLDNSNVSGILELKINSKNLSNIFYKISGETDFISVNEKFDTKNLKDGKKYLIIKGEDKNKKVIYKQIQINIDNYDEPPIIECNLIDNKMLTGKYLLRIKSYDDRGDIILKCQIDEENISLQKENDFNYNALIDTKNYKDNSSHILTISSKDNSGQTTEKKIKFFVDNKKPIIVELPYNLDRISFNENRKDAFEWSFPAEELPESDSIAVCNSCNTKFYFPKKENGEKNFVECRRQKINVKKGNYKFIHIFGYSFWGNRYNDLELGYEDGSKEIKQLYLSEWTGAEPQFNDHIAIYASHHHEHTDSEGAPSVACYHTIIECNKNKLLKYIKLPDDAHKHILAITLE